MKKSSNVLFFYLKPENEKTRRANKNSRAPYLNLKDSSAGRFARPRNCLVGAAA